MRQDGFTVETTVAAGAPAGVLLAGAHRRGADLIVLSTHRRVGLGRWIHGSVARTVRRDAEVPVVLVPPGKPT